MPPPPAWLKPFPPPPPFFCRGKTSHFVAPLPIISDQSLNSTVEQVIKVIWPDTILTILFEYLSEEAIALLQVLLLACLLMYLRVA